jgi:hypothetical protein
VHVLARLQLMAKGSFPGRVMATRPPEEVVQGMMRDLLSGIAALVNAPDPALVTLAVKLLKNLVSHELVSLGLHPNLLGWSRFAHCTSRLQPSDRRCCVASHCFHHPFHVHVKIY